jgi:DNA-binding transcriptional LysR family regulator
MFHSHKEYQIDTLQLKAFMLVAETASFSQAAEQLHITQPAVSKRVALLEQQLDTSLFDRIGRSVSLTEAGRALLPHARRVEQEMQAAEQSVRDLAGEVSGRLRLATSHHIGLHRLPPILSRFNKLYGAVQIDIAFMDSEQAYELIAQGKVELAVATLAPNADPTIITQQLWHDPLEFLVSADHTLSTDTPLNLQQLSKMPAILPGLNTYTGQIVKRLFDQHGLELQVSLATNYLETIRMMTSVGLGWTVLPRTMKDSTLIAVDVEEIAIARDLGLVYHRDRSLSRAAQSFIQCLLNE